MKASFAALVLVLAAASSAQADIINCVFTEPFLSTSYSMAQQSLTIEDPISEHPKTKKTVLKNVSFQIRGAGSFELVAKDGKVLQRLELTGKGSDGMSDNVFPYEVRWNIGQSLKTWANYGEHHGGCTSNYLKKTIAE